MCFIVLKQCFCCFCLTIFQWHVRTLVSANLRYSINLHSASQSNEKANKRSLDHLAWHNSGNVIRRTLLFKGCHPAAILELWLMLPSHSRGRELGTGTHHHQISAVRGINLSSPNQATPPHSADAMTSCLRGDVDASHVQRLLIHCWAIPLLFHNKNMTEQAGIPIVLLPQHTLSPHPPAPPDQMRYPRTWVRAIVWHCTWLALLKWCYGHSDTDQFLFFGPSASNYGCNKKALLIGTMSIDSPRALTAMQ